MRALIFFVSMILTLINLKAQNSTFRFKILDGSTGKRITQGIISYEDTLGNFEKFTVLDSSITQDIVPNKTLILTINSIDYHAYIEKMVFPYKEIKNFFLKRDTAYQLNEVVVRPKSYNYLPDTVSRKVKDLKLPTDIKIEDVLKRFPGVKVDENGRITYRNKPVETVLLDGENLMQSNYQLATQNIGVNEIEEIEAYDHFSENSIIAGLGSSISTALNLKFARKFSYTQSGKAATGFVGDALDGYQFQSNSIVNTKFVKTFALVSSNNVGENNSSLNYTDFRNYSPLYENLPAFPLAYGGAFPNEGKLKLNRNQQWAGNLNNILKLHRKLTFKSYTNFLKDEFSNRQSNSATINLPGNTFSTSDEYNFRTSPKKWGHSFVMKYQPVDFFILEGKYYLNRGAVQYETNQLINEQVGFASQQNSTIRDYYLENLATLRTGNKSAFQVLYQQLFSRNGVDLKMNYSAPLSFLVNQNLLQNYEENKLTGKWIKVWSVRKVITETWFQYLDFQQNLSPEKRLNSFFNEYRKTFRLEVKGDWYGWVYNGAVENIQLTTQNNTLPANLSRWNSEFSLNSTVWHQNFSLQFSDKLLPDYRQYFIRDTLFVNSRNLRLDSVQNNFPKSRQWSFSLGNSAYSTLHYQINYMDQTIFGNYFQNGILSNLFSLQKNQWLNVTSSVKNANAELGYYLKPIAVNFKLVAARSIMAFPNVINNGMLRENKSTSNSLTISAKSGYLKAFNFYEAFTIEQTSFENQFSVFKNQIYRNTLNLYFNKDPWNAFVQLNSYQFFPNDTFLHFLNAEISYKSPKRKVGYNLNMQNLLNIKDRSFISVNDFSKTVFKNYLLGRTVMIGIEFSL